MLQTTGLGWGDVSALGCADVETKMSDEAWLAAFHNGDRAVVERCYRDECAHVLGATGRMLSSADAETVTHEVFLRLLSDANMRKNFVGGSFSSWIKQVAVHAAIDHVRKYRRETQHDGEEIAAPSTDESEGQMATGIEAKVLIDRFRREVLPPAWAGVFDARFLRQLTQRDAARELGMHRTTLVYQEQRLRALLRNFVLEGAGS